jgi:hypothetical protein
MVRLTCYNMLLVFWLANISRLDAFLMIQSSPQYSDRLKYDYCSASTTHKHGGPSATTTTITTTSLNAQPAAPRQQSFQERARRQELLSRNGPYFQLNKRTGNVGFGATAQLATKLQKLDDDDSEEERPSSSSNNSADDVAKWLSDSDGRGLALSIWDPDLITDLGNSVYRLQTMDLQFVTIKLAPSVDIQMWTTTTATTTTAQQQQQQQQPVVFSIQSIDYNPNIQLLPGLGVPADALGVTIEVVGELRPSRDGTGVTGVVSFQSSGILPLPMRILPEGVLKSAAEAFNQIIVDFAVASFQKGAIAKFQEFQQQQQQQKQQTTQ